MSEVRFGEPERITITNRAGGAGMDHEIRYVSNSEIFGDLAPAAAASVVGTVFMGFIQVPVRMTIDAIAVASAGGPNGARQLRLCLYENGTPGFLDIADGGDVVGETAAFAPAGIRLNFGSLVGGDTQVEAGIYHLACQCDNAAYTFYAWGNPTTIDAAAAQEFGRTFNQAFGAFTDPCPATGATWINMWAGLRVVSVP